MVLTKIYAATFQVTASIERVTKLMNKEAPVEPLEIKNNQDLSFSSIIFDQVCFQYPGTETYALQNVSFELTEGDLIGIVGPSGSGKSTLVNLIAKYYLPTTGEICIDNRLLSDIPAPKLRSNIAYVPQESLLFKSTILDNCRTGNPNASIDDVIDALKLANAWEFVQELPKKLLTKIGTQGLTLSGGQRQRLSIARAILSRPKLLILDEATSALDSHSEEKIQAAIQSLKGKFTMIIIAHRLSTIKDASKIIVIDSGKIRDIGSHADLVERDGIYLELLQKQSVLT